MHSYAYEVAHHRQQDNKPLAISLNNQGNPIPVTPLMKSVIQSTFCMRRVSVLFQY